MGIEKFVKKTVSNWEARRSSPGFQAEMLREKTEFKDQLKEVGKSVRDFAWVGIIKQILGGAVSSSAKLAFKKKYKLGDLFVDTAKSIGKTTLLGANIVWEILKTTGKAAKITVRQLIAR